MHINHCIATEQDDAIYKIIQMLIVELMNFNEN